MIVIGAEGQLGHELVRESRNRGHRVRSWGRAQLDVTDAAAVGRRIGEERLDWVLNAAAYNDVDGAEESPGDAMAVNALGVRAVALACRAAGATLLHFSTDYVFGGRKAGVYSEADLPRPLSAYGVSKLAGECFARSALASHYVLRVAGVYGPAGRATRRGNFVEAVLRRCEAGRRLTVVADQFATPTFAPALARRSLAVLERGLPFGLYHLGGGERLSWHEFAARICSRLGRRCDMAAASLADSQRPASRPRDAALSNRLIHAAGIEPMPGVDECLRQYLELRRRS